MSEINHTINRHIWLTRLCNQYRHKRTKYLRGFEKHMTLSVSKRTGFPPDFVRAEQLTYWNVAGKVSERIANN